MIGMGAANVATYRLLKAAGADPARIIACDTQGTLHRNRRDIEDRQSEFREKWMVCRETNSAAITGGIEEAMRGADVCIAFACPDPTLIHPAWVGSMAHDAIIFACANPAPEIWPRDAKKAGARIAASGRSDLPNQVNNSLVFPAIFRGTLDACASTISEEMALAAAHELARCAEERGLSEDAILPRMDDVRMVARVAAATAFQAQKQGLARVTRTREEYMEQANRCILHARHISRLLTKDALEREH